MTHGQVKRHKPSNEARAATHPATDSDYVKLSVAVIRAIVMKEKDVVLKLPYFVQLSDDLPKGVLEKRDEHYNYYRAKTFKLADYLFKLGFLPGDAKTLVKATRTVVNMEGMIDRLLITPEKEILSDVKNPIDEQKNLMYNDSSEIKEKE